jgi:hypothetical protein
MDGSRPGIIGGRRNIVPGITVEEMGRNREDGAGRGTPRMTPRGGASTAGRGTNTGRGDIGFRTGLSVGDVGRWTPIIEGVKMSPRPRRLLMM